MLRVHIKTHSKSPGLYELCCRHHCFLWASKFKSMEMLWIEENSVLLVVYQGEGKTGIVLNFFLSEYVMHMR